MISIQRREWYWLAGWSFVILVLATLPHLSGMSNSTPQMQYGGFVIGTEDGNSYLSEIQQGRSGNWLFYLPYTSEPHSGAIFFLFYIILGHLSRWLNFGLFTALYLGWTVNIVFELVTNYCFAAFFTDSKPIRRTSFLLFAFTAGFGWLWVVLGFPAQLGQMPIDMWVPDVSFFLGALSSPHLGLAHGLMLWFFIGSLQFLEQGRFKYWLLASGAGLLASFIHPYKLIMPGLLLGLFWLWQVYRYKQPLWRGVWRLVLVALPSLPYLAYTAVVFETNPVFNGWRLQNPSHTPLPQYLLLGLGLLLPLALLGLYRLRDITLKQSAFLVIWVGVVPLLIYLPSLLQRRFLHGYQTPLAIMAAIGLVYLVDKIPRHRWRMPVTAGLIVFMGLTNLLLLTGAMITVGGQQPPIFLARQQLLAFGWLADNSPPRHVVLSAFETGNALPAYAPLSVFLGHGSITVNSEEKRQLVDQFFEANTPDLWRQALLTDNGISYLFYGSNEQSLGDFDPTDAPYLHQIYDNDSVQLFEVNK